MSFNQHKNAKSGWKANKHWVVCDICGFDFRVDQVQEDWQGLVVCKYDYEPRHPQDLIRGVKDNTSPVGLVRTEPADVFTTIDYCVFDSSSRAGYAIAGCARAGSTVVGLENETVPTGTFDNSL
jgi:hypothetical protein